MKDSEGNLRQDVNTARGFPNVESFLKIERTVPIPDLVYQNCSEFEEIIIGGEALCNAGKICFYTDEACIKAYESADESYVTVTGDNEVLGMTRRIAALVRFKCEDSESKVKTEDEFKNLSAEIIVRFAVLKGSEPPEFCTTEDGPICLYGASGNIIGLECTPWDDCFLDPQDEAVCGVCECMNGSQIISPIGDLVGQPLWDRHETGETFDCLDPNDPACAWCHSKGGLYKCPSAEEFIETTTECQALLDEIISEGKSEQCLLYKCDVEDGIVKRGCVWQDFPIPCDSCRRCEQGTDGIGTGQCIPDTAKEGETCVANPKPVGADQACYKCTREGTCIINELAIGTTICSNSQGCYTYCSDNGTCTFVNEEDIDLQCPTNKPDYMCTQC